MEFIKPEWLRTLGEGRIYNYLADLSSLLTISSTASRLPVYFHCSREIRKQLRHFFAQFEQCGPKKEAVIMQTDHSCNGTARSRIIRRMHLTNSSHNL
ncbi:hypothetical protein OSTOST_10665 [Ostertagia ostertagi]